jgi:glycine hydroxymethyltransferase
MHVIAAKAIAFQEALSDSFHTYTTQVVKNASTMAQALLDKGYNVVSGGTDNHLMLIDLRNKNLTGKQAELALDKSGITCNKNAVPYDTQPPLITSGIRLGAAAMTSRGFKEQDMKQIAEFIDTVLSNISQEGIPEKVKQEVKDYCKDFSIYPSI